MSAATKRNTTDFLKLVSGRPVTIKLQNGTIFKGVVANIDDSMNVALEQTTEFQGDKMIAQYGDSFIRGNNIMYINLQRKKKATA